MAFKLYSDVRETSTTGGTGDQVLTGSAFDASYFRFNDRYSDADTFFYCMKQGTSREIGLGTRVATGDKVSRTQIYKSTNSNNLVNFTALQTIDIFVCAIAPSDLDAAGLGLLLSLEKGQSRTITGADSITIADHNKTILLNSASAATVSLSAVATLGDGFKCWFKNINTGVITLDPNSSETIDGETTILVPKGDSGQIHCTGAVLHTLERPAVVFLGSGAASGTSLDLAIPAGFDVVEFDLTDWRPASDSQLWARLSVDGGSSYIASSYGYSYFLNDTAGTPSGGGSASDVSLLVSGTAEADANHNITSSFRIFAPQSSGGYSRSEWRSDYFSPGGTPFTVLNGRGTYGSAGPFTHIRFLQSTGNITSGRYTMRGIRRA